MLQTHLQKLQKVLQNIKRVVVGQNQAIELILISLLAGGHVLMEDVPGVGKTTLARALALSLDLDFGRIQFTPDVMPSDITGYNVYNPQSGQFEFHPGAVMCQILLADEINRSSPKTQSSLLEAMQDKQVTVDGESYDLKSPFMVLATQNSIEQLGTYPLPEAQLDRFMMKFSLGYPVLEEEVRIFRLHGGVSPFETLNPVLTESEVLTMQRACTQIYAAPQVEEYIARIAAASRNHRDLRLGISPRGSLLLLQAAKGRAMLHERDYVLPRDIHFLAPFVLAHRIMLSEAAQLSEMQPEDILAGLLREIPVPPAQ